MTAPNDILIRITRNDDGTYSRDVAIAINDETMLPEMERTAEYLTRCLELFSRPDARIEYKTALDYADALAMPKGRVLVGR